MQPFGQIASIDALGNRTAYAYDPFGNLASVTDPLGNTTVYGYDLRGNRTYEGGATYPVRYTYDIFGEKTAMTTYRDEAQTNGDTTTWLYDEPSGLVTNKLYADGKGPSYAYTPNGNLAARTWARGIVTAYAYDGWGSLTNTVYSDGTPSVSLAYDALGRQVETRDAAGVTAYAYDDAGSLTSEVVTGVAGTNVVTRHWDVFDRSLGYSLNGIRQTTLAYDPATGRLASMLAAGNANPFAWSYLPGTDLKSQLTYPNGLTAAWAYDADSRLTQVRNAAQNGAVSQYGYAYDAASRRVSCAKSGSAMGDARTDIYGYNARSELVSSARTGGSPSPATEHEYAYDPIGNRTSSSDLGTTRTYTANSINQYTGLSDGVNTFAPQFDDDGDQTLIQTKTGVWSVTYNGDNRPVSWSCGETNVIMSFDRMGRRVQYTETVGNVTNAHHTFVYDNYLQIADNSGSHYLWDPTEPVATRPLVWLHGGSAYSYTHDGNKNVSEVVDANGAVTAHYEYAPFGDVTAAVGNLASANCFRFSSEYSDDTLGLVYYNYRHYEPVTGRWMSRDYYDNTLIPYSFVDNDVANCYDDLGLSKRPARNSDRDQRGGHRSRKNGNKGDKHSRAYGHGGRENPRRVRVDRRGKPIKTPIKGNKGCVSTSALSVAGAIETGLIVGNVAVWAFEEMGWYDETVDWSYKIKGELCCEYPFMPVVTEIFVKIKDGEAILSGPLWGILTTNVSAEYEIEKQTTITFSCCCENPKRVGIDIQKLSVNVYENWLWGVIGSSRGVARLTTVSIKTPCGR